jgi:hypothetical protein
MIILTESGAATYAGRAIWAWGSSRMIPSGLGGLLNIWIIGGSFTISPRTRIARLTNMREQPMRQGKCRWQCGRITKNISGICNDCWQAAEALRSNTDSGYRAWLEHKRAKTAKGKRPMSAKQAAALDEARRAKSLKQLPGTELSDD